MQMVAALDVEWDGIAERFENLIRPRAHRHHDFARGDGALPRRKVPARARLLERARIADDKAAAPAAEQPSIGFGQSAGIGHEAGRGKEDRTGKIAAETGFKRADPLGVEDVAGDTILFGALELACGMAKRGLRAKQL